MDVETKGSDDRRGKAEIDRVFGLTGNLKIRG